VSWEEIETPAAVVDADRLERNLARWQDYCERHELANRPHVKTHRCVESARRQLNGQGIEILEMVLKLDAVCF